MKRVQTRACKTSVRGMGALVRLEGIRYSERSQLCWFKCLEPANPCQPLLEKTCGERYVVLSTDHTVTTHACADIKKPPLAERRRCQLGTDFLRHRGDRIRTCGILLPKQARYQTAPLPGAFRD